MPRYKYPRTPHLPYSPGVTSDDKILRAMDQFNGRRVIVSIKQDGENTSLYSNGLHARSLDSRHHPSRDWVKAYHGSIAHRIPEGWRICGENLYAQHSIAYSDLPSYFLAFSVWNSQNWCLSWDDTQAFLNDLGVVAVPVIYDGIFNEKAIEKLAFSLDTSMHEGLVLRLSDSFHYDDFGQSVAKFVRAGHVQTGEHWMQKAVTPNKLRTE